MPVCCALICDDAEGDCAVTQIISAEYVRLKNRAQKNQVEPQRKANLNRFLQLCGISGESRRFVRNILRIPDLKNGWCEQPGAV